MKLRKMQQLCFENDLSETHLLIQFITKIFPKREFSYQQYEYDITENEFEKWIKRFRSGNPVHFMTKDEIRSFVAVIMRYI